MRSSSILFLRSAAHATQVMIGNMLHILIPSSHIYSSLNLNPSCFSRIKHTNGMHIHSPGFCCNPGRRDRPINTKQRKRDPGLNGGDLDHKFTNPSVPLTLRMARPRFPGSAKPTLHSDGRSSRGLGVWVAAVLVSRPEEEVEVG